jgi:glutaconate CoA-transferase subunit A
MDKRVSLKEAIELYVEDGGSVCFSGMAGGQCVAQTMEIIRQRRKGLTLYGDSPCEAGDLLAGAGAVDRMEIAFCAYAVAGLGHNFRRAVEDGVPHRIEVRDYTNFSMGLRFLAAAINVPYLPLRSLIASDIPEYNKDIIIEKDPFTNENVALVSAARPDVAIVHVLRADRRGNGQIIGFSANAENLARAAGHTILTCEEIVSTDEIRKYGNLTIIPEYCVDAVVELPYACHPWNMPYAYAYDMPFHTKQIENFTTREGFLKWIEEWCFQIGDHEAYMNKVGLDRLMKLTQVEKKFSRSNYV